MVLLAADKKLINLPLYLFPTDTTRTSVDKILTKILSRVGAILLGL